MTDPITVRVTNPIVVEIKAVLAPATEELFDALDVLTEVADDLPWRPELAEAVKKVVASVKVET